MSYVRLSIVRPRRGEAERVTTLMKDLTESAKKNPACLEAYVLAAADGTGDLARIAIYKDEKDADHAAGDSHILSLRSELHLAVEPGHIERAFTIIQ
jgi:hypothetical protein